MGTFPLLLVPPFSSRNTLYMLGLGGLGSTSRNSTKKGKRNSCVMNHDSAKKTEAILK